MSSIVSTVTHSINATQANFENDVLKASLNTPVLVDFWADWCGPCKSLGPVLEKLAAEFNGAFTLAKVNADTEQALVGMFGVRSLPTVVMIKDGQIADGFAGALPEGEIRAFLAKFVEGPILLADDTQAANQDAQATDNESPEQAIARLQKTLAADPDNSDLKLELATALMRTGDVKTVAAMFESLPSDSIDDPRAARLRLWLALAKELDNAPQEAELRSRIEQDPKDLAAHDLLGARLLLDGQAEPALEEFLRVLATDRAWNEGRARQRLLMAFQMLDDATLVGTYRRKMASLLF